MKRNSNLFLVFWLVTSISVLIPDSAFAKRVEKTPSSENLLLPLLEPDPIAQRLAMDKLGENWHDNLVPALLEFISLNPNPELQVKGFQLLLDNTSRDFGYDINAWFYWAWSQKHTPPVGYAGFKSKLYSRIDPKFAGYFSSAYSNSIQLDEVRWGGVLQDGIPPLRNPKMIPAEDANYLADDNVIFGLEVNGDFRAYPKRILAWHEMFVDEVGGVPVVGVYCTLCGSMILYESRVNDVAHAMGTSGFLYRSNKLMYDRATQSLWNTMWGTPAIGPLVGKNIRLPRRTVVTTTWREWRTRHPETSVLSLSTGYARDYGEGVAYQDYFATDDLMFNSSQIDTRLPNKAEVLGLVFNDTSQRPLAISAAYANNHALLHESVGELTFVVLTDHSGAMRVYESREIKFSHWDRNQTLKDSTGHTWSLREDSLLSDSGRVLSRLPSHSAFWFGWYGAYTNTRLIYE